MAKTKKGICPICEGKVAEDAPTRPFCSDRCKQVDLGNWFTEGYVIREQDPHADPDELLEEIQKAIDEGRTR